MRISSNFIKFHYFLLPLTPIQIFPAAFGSLLNYGLNTRAWRKIEKSISPLPHHILHFHYHVRDHNIKGMFARHHDTQHNDIQHNNALLLCWVSLWYVTFYILLCWMSLCWVSKRLLRYSSWTTASITPLSLCWVSHLIYCHPVRHYALLWRSFWL